jgi:hypothetical protein
LFFIFCADYIPSLPASESIKDQFWVIEETSKKEKRNRKSVIIKTKFLLLCSRYFIENAPILG